MKKYIVLLKNKSNVKDFMDYLMQNNIVIDFKEEEALIFIILTDENGANAIKALSYVQEIVDDKSFKIDEEELEKENLKEENVEKEISSREAQVNYRNWGVNRVLAPCMWRRGITGQGVNVAVLDTGIGPHVDLVVSGNVSFTGETPQDVQGHGTHVAGIIAGRNFATNSLGVAYDVNLFNVKVLDNNGHGTTAWLIQGITWCGNNNIDVANMSLYYQPGEPNAGERAAIQAAIDFSIGRGCIFVSISGNNGINTVAYPAAANGVISVGSININNVRAGDSNFGPGLDYVAPGVNIVSTFLNNGYASLSGTSMASPHVAAMVALLLSEDPLRTQPQIEGILTNAALNLGNPGYDIQYGNGLVRSPRFPMTLIANPSKGVYDCEKTGAIDIFAYDNLGRPIEEVPINITIVTPSGNVINITGRETDNNGKCTLEMLFNCCNCNPNPGRLLELNEIGNYLVTVDANPTCSLPAIANTSFVILQCGLQAFVDTNKNSYLSIDNGVVIGAVKDTDDKAVENADVMFIITSSTNKKTVVEETTNNFGLAYFNFQTDCPGVLPWTSIPVLNEIGNYTVEMEATKTCHNTALAVTSFDVLKTHLKGYVLIKKEICVNSNELLRIEVKDQFNRMVSNAKVEVSIISPSNEVKVFNLITNKSGQAHLNIVTNMYCYHEHHGDTYFAKVCGEYKIDARISKAPCYENTEANGEFKVKGCFC